MFSRVGGSGGVQTDKPLKIDTFFSQEGGAKMAVFRIEKTRDYTVMSNHHLKDRTLTLKSKGLLSMMLSLPDEWNYTIRGLAAICREGVDSIGAALKELETHGSGALSIGMKKARSRIPSMSFTKCLSASRRQAQVRLYRVRQSHIRKTPHN